MEQFVEFWGMFRRRFWIITLVCLIGLPVVGLYAYLKLPVYQAEAKILVESQQIPDDLARSTVTASAGERLQLIEQRLMARGNLLKLIRELGLYANRTDLTLTEKITELREATRIQPITLTGRRSRRIDAQLSAFIIRVVLDDPAKAARLANEYVTTVLDQNVRARSERARETTAFFTQEQERLNAEIIALEQEIILFKEKNRDALPGSLAFRQSELSRMAETDLELHRRLLELEEGHRGILTDLETIAAAGPEAVGLSEEERELRALERVLLQKEAVLAPSHPNIRALRRRIEALRAALPEAAGRPGAKAAISRAEASLKRKLELFEAQMALLVEQKTALGKKHQALLETLERTPTIEIQLNALDRRLREKQEMHAVITRKRTEAETGERMEVNQQAERFEVIENAIVPQEPIAPNRRKIVILGSGAVMALALALALMVEKMRPRIYSAAQLERQTGLRAAVVVPVLRTRRDPGHHGGGAVHRHPRRAPRHRPALHAAATPRRKGRREARRRADHPDDRTPVLSGQGVGQGDNWHRGPGRFSARSRRAPCARPASRPGARGRPGRHRQARRSRP